MNIVLLNSISQHVKPEARVKANLKRTVRQIMSVFLKFFPSKDFSPSPLSFPDSRRPYELIYGTVVTT